MKKGFFEVFPTTIIIIFCIIVFLVTVFIVFKYFLDSMYEVSLHEMDRKMNDFSSNFLTNCSLLYIPGILNGTKLDSIAGSLYEPCFRYCEYGTYVKVTDLVTGDVWDFGYKGFGVDSRKMTLMAGIYNERSPMAAADDSVSTTIPSESTSTSVTTTIATTSTITTTTTAAITCPESQENCPSISAPLTCISACCAWAYDDKPAEGRCTECAGLSKEECDQAKYRYGVCSFDSSSGSCSYTGKYSPDPRNFIHAGEIYIAIYRSKLLEITCAAEKAVKTGKTQYMNITKDDFYKISEGTATIRSEPYKDGSRICINMPMFEYYYENSDVCRMMYWATGVNNFQLAAGKEVLLSFEKSGTTAVIKEVTKSTTT